MIIVGSEDERFGTTNVGIDSRKEQHVVIVEGLLSVVETR